MNNDTVRISPDNPFTLRERILRDIEYNKSRLIDLDKYPFKGMTGTVVDEAKEANASMQKSLSDMQRTYQSLFGITVLHIDNLWGKELKRRRRELHWWNFKAIRELDWDEDEWKAAKRQELEEEAQAIKNIIY
jgi:hypothetical protein